SGTRTLNRLRGEWKYLAALGSARLKPPTLWAKTGPTNQGGPYMKTTSPRRVAILGVHLESNAFAPVTRETDFRALCSFEGDAIMVEARKAAPALPAEVAAFVAEMDRSGPWTPVPIIVTGAEPGGPADGRFLGALLGDIRACLQAAGPLDGVYISNHGGMT